MVIDKEDDELELTLQDSEGKEQKVSIKATLNEEVKWKWLVPEQGIPFSLVNEERNYWYYEDKENGIMYFSYSACAEQNEQSLHQVFKEMIEKMKQDDGLYTTLVMDIKYNGGGNRYLLQSKLAEFQDYLKNKKICIIIGNQTASAAVQAIEDCMTYFDDITLYGQPTAGAVNNYTEISRFQLPNSKLVYIGPTVKDNLPLLSKKYGDVKESVMPDVPVLLSLEDYMNGVDTVYQKIVEDVN